MKSTEKSIRAREGGWIVCPTTFRRRHGVASEVVTRAVYFLAGATFFAGLTAGCTGFQATSTDGGGGDGSSQSPFTVVQGLPEGETFQGIWGSDPDHLFVVGTNGVHDDYAFGMWNRTQIDMGRDYYSIWGDSPTDVYAVGEIQGTGQGIVVHFDGTSWRDEYVADTALYGVWGTANVVVAAGASGMIWGKHDGANDWGKLLSMGLPANPNVPAMPNEPILWAIGGTGLTDFAMPADVDRIFQYQGSGNYANLDPIPDRSIIFLSMWADPNTPGSVYFGSNYFGINWLTPNQGPPGATLLTNNMYRLFQDQSQPGSDQLFIRGIWGAGTSVIFVGDQGRIYTYDGASDDTAALASPTSSSLSAVWGSAVDDVWIVGQRELILHGSLAP